MSKKVNTEKFVYINNKLDGYRLGHIDHYSVSVQYTPLENSSFYHGVFKEKIDGPRLINALRSIMDRFPLFKTQLVFKKEHYLKINNNDVAKVVKNVNVIDRPKEFGSIKTTNGYLFQICYFENNITFEWCHAITDGKGALDFYSCLLDAYFNVKLPPIPKEFPLELSYDTIFDPKNESSLGQIKQDPGFKASSLPLIKNGYKCNTTILKIPTEDIIALSKRANATPVAIIAPLLCKAIRSHIPAKIKNKNVSCGIMVDGRKSLGFDTMHNSVFFKIITYNDKIDSKDIETQGTMYRSMLDLYCLKENLIAHANAMLLSVDSLYRMKPLFLRRFVMNIVGRIVKTRMNNIAFSYLGRVPFSQTVKDNMIDFSFRSWPDIGGCVGAMADLNGTLILNITDNYVDKGIVDTFVSLCKQNNIRVTKEKPFIFEQANVRTK